MTLTGRLQPEGVRTGGARAARGTRRRRLPPLPPPPPAVTQVTLEPYERDHAVVVGVYRSAKKKEP